MSYFAVSKIRWNKERTRIISVILHQFIVGKHSDLDKTFGIDPGKEAGASAVASMIVAGGDIIKIVTFNS